MKTALPLALFLAGITAAVLAGPAIPPKPDTAAPGAGDGDVTLSRDGRSTGDQAVPQLPAMTDFAAPPVADPRPLQPGLPPLPGAPDGMAGAVNRLQGTPAMDPAAAGGSLAGMGEAEAASLISSMPAQLQPVPEPATWIMMLSGFGLVGLGARRRHLATL